MAVNVVLFLVASLVTSQVSFADAVFFDGNTSIIETVTNWFRSIKEFLFGKSRSLKAPEDVELLQMTDEEIQQMRLSHPKEFFLDLQNLQFNAQDWGFHIGNWLIIRVHELEKNFKGWKDAEPDEIAEDKIHVPVDEE